MRQHIDIISELIEFANQNWSAFNAMLEEREYNTDEIEDDLSNLEEDVYSL